MMGYCKRVIRTRALLLLGICLLWSVSAFGQYQFNYDTEPDTAKSDTTEAIEAESGLEAETPLDVIVERAKNWTRRMFYRGFLTTSTSGTWATYQESDWGPKQGAHGPIRAHFTVNYLGPTTWITTQAERFQCVYRTLDTPKMTIEFDLVLGLKEAKVDTIYRSLHRVNKGNLHPISFAVPEGTLDYDKLDKPDNSQNTQLKLYSGTYDATIYAGTGVNAAKVYAYRVADLPPLNLVVLGYGKEALIIKSSGDGAESRFEAPLPSMR